MPEQSYDEKADEALILARLASDQETAEAYRRLAVGYRALARLHEHYHPDHYAGPVAPAAPQPRRF